MLPVSPRLNHEPVVGIWKESQQERANRETSAGEVSVLAPPPSHFLSLLKPSATQDMAGLTLALNCVCWCEVDTVVREARKRPDHPKYKGGSDETGSVWNEAGGSVRPPGCEYWVFK